MADRKVENLLTHARRLNDRVLSGDVLGAFEDFYSEEVVMQENTNDPVKGKDANRKREEQWVENVTEINEAKVLSVGVDPTNDTTLTEWILDYNHKEWGDVRQHQVSVAKWRDGKVVNERFIYDS